MSKLVEVKVPDIGDYNDIPVIEICVQVGDRVEVDDALVTLESDKATMDVPASAAGIVKEIRVVLGDRLSQGRVVALLESAAAVPPVAAAAPNPAAVMPAASSSVAPAISTAPALAPAASQTPLSAHLHASPSVRQFARGLGVDLGKVTASGPKGRILKVDVTAFVKGTMSGAFAASNAPSASLGGGLDLLPWPKIDFAKFGPVEVQPLSRIKKITGQNLARNWAMIPAVTYHEEADITELEAFRLKLNVENAKSGVKLTLLPFLLKACAIALKKFPEFNSSLDGENLLLKKYFHIAFAADTPAGLVVPVVKDVDQKSLLEIAVECSSLAKKARDGKLSPSEMSGACFTISSIGSIGGSFFSPIINAPEVAILGAGKAAMKPVWNGHEFVPRLQLPLSLTADHRVIDGALGTRFNVYIAALLADLRRALL